MDDIVRLSRHPKIAEAAWNDEERKFISKLTVCAYYPTAAITYRLKPGNNPNHADFLDTCLASPVWDKISSAMGPEEYQKMWNNRLVFIETTGRLQFCLNGTLPLCCPERSSGKQPLVECPSFNYHKFGYNPRILIDRTPIMKKKSCQSRRSLIPNFPTLCTMIKSQRVGYDCDSADERFIPPQHAKLLNKFCRRKLSIKTVKKTLFTYRPKGQNDKPLTSNEIMAFMLDILDVVPRKLIGPTKAFKRFKLNVSQCVVRNPSYPVRLGTLMKGLPTYRYPVNVFLAKFVLFITTRLGVKLLSDLFYVTENLKNKQLLFFTKRKWATFETASVKKMVSSGVLMPVDKSPCDASRLRITYKPRGFRPLVHSSSHHKLIRHRLSVCNTFLKQVVTQLNPGYGRVLDYLHSQWSRIPRVQKKHLFFVRTDILNAFQSINHDKLQEILIRRLSAMEPFHVLRTYLFKSRGRTKSVMQFTTVHQRLSKKKVFIEAGRKVYTTSYLKAVIFQYIKHNFLTNDNKTVYRQIKGVPQGCYLSAVLCELYLSDMDNCYLNHLKSDGEVLVRGVDDYLFLTPEIKKANTFLAYTKDGITEYGISFQLEKTETNARCPRYIFPFYGYVFFPHCRKIVPDFTEWTDLTGRIRFDPQMSWSDLTKRASMISYIKLHKLIFDPSYLDKYVVMKNMFFCAKIHARKLLTIYSFLLENCPTPPNTNDKLIPILTACRVMCSRIRSLNEGPGSLHYREIKLVILTAFKCILEPTQMFQDVMIKLYDTINGLWLRGGIPKRSKKLVKSLTKPKTSRF